MIASLLLAADLACPDGQVRLWFSDTLSACVMAHVPSAGPTPLERVTKLEAQLRDVKRTADGTFLDAAIIAPAGFWDVYTTEKCFQENPRCAELNRLGFNGTTRVGVKTAVYPLKVAVRYALRRLHHHHWARVTALVFAGVDVAQGFRNLDIAHK